MRHVVISTESWPWQQMEIASAMSYSFGTLKLQKITVDPLDRNHIFKTVYCYVLSHQRRDRNPMHTIDYATETIDLWTIACQRPPLCRMQLLFKYHYSACDKTSNVSKCLCLDNRSSRKLQYSILVEGCCSFRGNFFT